MEEVTDGISRRTALKRIGVGAAVVWTAPMVLSIESPAFAGSQVCTNCDTTCPRAGTQCGPGHFCLQRIGTSGCVCVFANFCSEGVDVNCTSDANCPSGYVCASTCCGSGGQPTGLCVQPSAQTSPPSSAFRSTSPATAPSPNWDVAGYLRCASDSDCQNVPNPYSPGATYQHCVPFNGMPVCQ